MGKAKGRHRGSEHQFKLLAGQGATVVKDRTDLAGHSGVEVVSNLGEQDTNVCTVATSVVFEVDSQGRSLPINNRSQQQSTCVGLYI